jgi:hypothetical protein
MNKKMNKNTITYLLQKKYVLLILLFLISFSYIYFFSSSLPFFYDIHEFHTTYTQMTNIEILTQMTPINTGTISAGHRPIKAMIAKSIFTLYGYEYSPYRIVYALIFGLFIVIIFTLAKYLFKENSIAAIFSLYIMTNFPLYIQTIGYGPHLYGELFKIVAIILFLRDFGQEKTSYTKQLLIYLFSLLAVRSYISAFSIAGILPLLTISYDRKKLIRYLPLFFFIILIQFPITLNTSTNTEFTPNLWSIQRAFLNSFWENITNPIPSYNGLYYKSFTAILSFFGFWLIVIVVIGLFLQWIHRKWEYRINKEREKENSNNEGGDIVIVKDNFQKVNAKLLLTLSSVWMLCELPSYIMLPEHAIRYIFPFTIPFFIFVTTLIVLFLQNIKKKRTKRIVIVFVLLMIISSMLISTSYIYAFRAGWGSSFIGFEHTMDYFAENHDAKTGVLYYAGSVAAEYKYVNKSSPTYEFGEGIDYIKTATLEDFNEALIKEMASEYEEFYVLKRVTSLSKAELPTPPFETYSSLIEFKVIEGTDETILFDRWNTFLMDLLNTAYEPNKIYVYKHTG